MLSIAPGTSRLARLLRAFSWSSVAKRPVVEPLESRALMSSVFWDGGAGTSNWQDAKNWSADVLPATGDDVTISVETDPTIFYSSYGTTLSLNSLTLDENLTWEAGTLIVPTLTLNNKVMTIVGYSRSAVMKDITFNVSGTGKVVGTNSMTFDNVTVNGDVELKTSVLVKNGFTLNGTAIGGAGLQFSGTQTLGGNAKFAGQTGLTVVSDDTTLTIGANVSFSPPPSNNHGLSISAGTHKNVTIINNAELSFGQKRLSIETGVSGTFINNGSITTVGGSYLELLDAPLGLGSGPGPLSATRAYFYSDLSSGATSQEQFDLTDVWLFGYYAPGGKQTIEVMSADVGATEAGFTGDFALGSVNLSSTYVTLVNAFDNSAGEEALYAQHVKLAANSTLDLNGLHIYTRSADIQGVVINGTITVVPIVYSLNLDTLTAGKIEVYGQIHHWEFTGTAGDTLNIEVNTGQYSVHPVGTPVLNNAFVELVDPYGNVIASGKNGSPEYSALINGVTLNDTGVYTLRLQGPEGATGKYTIAAWVAEEPVATPWGSYIGKSAQDTANGVAHDAFGNVYVIGTTASASLASQGYDTSFGGETDAYVIKYSFTGEFLWSTYLGGAGADEGQSIVVDAEGNVFASGNTLSSGWASEGSDTTHNGSSDGFLVKLSGTGQHLWSTYLGGTGWDSAPGLAVDNTGNLYVSGSTNSPTWFANGQDTTPNGGYDAYALKLDSAGQTLWGTYMGGGKDDYGYQIAVDNDGNAFIAAGVASAGLATLGAYDTTYGGSLDGMVFKLSTTGQLTWATYLGNNGMDGAYGVATDSKNNVYITGSTSSAGWISGGWLTTRPGGSTDGFVVKLGADGGHLWSSYLGGTGTDYARGISVGLDDAVYVAGGTKNLTAAPGDSWVSHGYDTTYNLGGDGFVVALTPSGQHAWSSYLGDDDFEEAQDVTVDGNGNVFVAGSTTSAGWIPVGYDTVYSGGSDGFVVSLVVPVRVTGFSGVSSPHTGPVGSVNVTFSELIDVGSFDWTSLTLTRDGSENLITAENGGSLTLTHLSDTTYTLAGLAGLTSKSGTYTLTLVADGVNGADGLGLAEDGATTFTVVNTAAIANMGAHPSPRTIPVGSTGIRFTADIDLATFTADDLVYTRDGVGISTAGITIVANSGGAAHSYTIVIPQSSNSQAGVYVLEVLGAGINNPGGTPVTNNFSTTWTTLPQMVNISQYPSARTQPVTAPGVRFRNPIAPNSFTWADVTLTRDGGENLVTSAFKIAVSPGDPNIYNILIPAGISSVPGVYTLTVNGAGIHAPTGYAINGVISTTWTQL